MAEKNLIALASMREVVNLYSCNEVKMHLDQIHVLTHIQVGRVADFFSGADFVEHPEEILEMELFIP